MNLKKRMRKNLNQPRDLKQQLPHLQDQQVKGPSLNLPRDLSKEKKQLLLKLLPQPRKRKMQNQKRSQKREKRKPQSMSDEVGDIIIYLKSQGV